MENIPEFEQVPQLAKTLDDLTLGNPVFLVGPAGTGKTSLAEKAAYALHGRVADDGEPPPFVVINCNQWTGPIDLKGGQTMDGYKEGGMVEAWREGKVLILDEMPKLDPNTAGILNDALAKTATDGAVIFNGLNEPAKKHPSFGCVATGNTLGKGEGGAYVGNNRQDASLLDRFSGSVYEIGFNETLERALVYPVLLEACWAIRKRLLEYEGKGEPGDIMSLRTMLNFQRAYLLEMKRETGVLRKERLPRWVPNGKTLKDAMESYFMVVGGEKAAKVKEAANMEAFYNSYRGREAKERFLREYKRRNG